MIISTIHLLEVIYA